MSSTKSMLQWSLDTLNLDLKYTWKIARGSTQTKVNYVVKVSDGLLTGLGEVAGITQKEALENIIPIAFKKIDFNSISSLESIYNLLIPEPLRFALESALVHLQCQKQNLTVWQYFKIPPPPRVLKTSFSLPILSIDEIQDFIKLYDVTRFSSCKIKVDKAHATEICRTVAKYFTGPLRIDANESFTCANETLEFLNSVRDLSIEFLEQPMPATLVQEYIELKNKAPIMIFADESVQFSELNQKTKQQFHGVNIKLMKAGSYKQALAQIQNAKALGLKIMLGCMVETSLGIKSALQLSGLVDYLDLDGFLFFKQEPFKLVKETSGELFIS